MFVVSVGWAETKTLTVTMTGYASGSTNAYVNTDTEGMDDDNTLSFMACGYNPGNGQLRGNKTSIEASSNGNFQIYNLDAIPGKIIYIKLSHTATGNNVFQNNVYVATGSSSQANVNYIDGLTPGRLNDDADEFTWTFNASDNISFFKICSNEKFTSGTVTGGQVTIIYEEVADARTPVTLLFSPEETDGTVGETFYAPTLSVEPNEQAITNEITYSSTNPNVATVDERSGEVTLVNRGTTKIYASYRGDDYYQPANTSYILHVYKESVVEDGFFDFVDKTLNYGSGLEPSSENDYITEPHTWTAINVTLETSGKYRWWEPDGTLRFYNCNPKSAMTFSVPYGYVITSITIAGGQQWTTDVGEYSGGYWEGLSRVVKLEANSSNSVDVRSVRVSYMEYVPSTLKIDPDLQYSAPSATAEVGYTFDAPTLSWAPDFTGTVIFSSSDNDVAEIDDQGVVTIKAAGTTTIMAEVPGDETYLYSSASYELTVTDPNPACYQYMTYCSTSKLDFTDKDLKAYIASGYVSGRIMLSRIYKVPAQTGIMIKSENEDLPAAFDETDYATTEDISAYYVNALVGVVQPTTITPTYNIAGSEYTTFVLAKPQDKDLGFYRISESGNLGANKAYLLVESSSLDQAETANGMTFEFTDGTDAIQAVESKNVEDGAWYTIQGVRVAQPAQSGIYIHNGAKVVVK